ncbi:carboxypeptidase regulatory-like domain-containing protein [Luteimonas composti]|uniref:Carboxypeptidase regulatory-like domain-containing protein n=1 Tax=Luteimonas composti TaxID=398257 RepID=A0ABT6MLM5_9GAMM|nr:carboxypeptidase regulatory-like domain-containing protein [Luteimonas composti]MDH7451537.1 carboxypeptidase regulatory-like domain-containing protein [Luteimonas composti]
MTLPHYVALLLAIAAAVAALRLWRAHRADPRRPRAWRLATLLALQPLLAAALYFGLFPLERALDPAELVVLTEGADAAAAMRSGGVAVALPEVAEVGGLERAPDLASALRRHPATARIRVLGAGLVARDRDAAAGIPIAFDPPPLPAGLVQLSLPERIVRGAGFDIAGRIEGVADASVALHDPAGRRVDATALDEDGGFVLHGIALEAGPAHFELRVSGGDGAPVAQSAVPLWIDAPASPKVLLLAGAPGPETRALRRWLADAGAQAQARVALGGGLQLGSASLDAKDLAGADLLVVDARAWSGLGDSGRARVLAAVREGLGLLLRADTPLAQASLRGLRAPGFPIEGGNGSAPWSLPPARVDDEQALRARLGSGSRDAPFDLAQAQARPPALTRRSWRVGGAQAVAFASAADSPAGWWRGEGRGRIGLWTLLDTYVLPLHGRGDLFDALWSPTLATLARARPDALPVVDAWARAGERLRICGWQQGATVEGPDGAVVQPIVDPHSGERRCVGLWPRRAGWYRLRLDSAERGFHVADADEAPALRLATLREATLALAAAAPRAPAGQGGARAAVRGPAWPWLLGWLLLAGLAWWLERSRLGLAGAARKNDAGRAAADAGD